MKKYKFKIYYTFKKENKRANTLNRKCDYMKIKEIFDKNILQVNRNETFSSNYKKITITMRIVKDDKKQFSIKKNKL